MNANRYAPRFVDVFCRGCSSFLFKYRKSSDGPVMKCFIDKIQKSPALTEPVCPQCKTEFGQVRFINGAPAWKMIAQAITWKRKDN
jgi:hypothetical protein